MSTFYHRKSIRLPKYDYLKNGFYFITICTQNRYPLFGKIINKTMQLNQYGSIANQCILDITNHFSNVFINCHVIMPDHIHAIIEIRNSGYRRGLACQTHQSTRQTHQITTHTSIQNTKNQTIQNIKINAHDNTRYPEQGLACQTPTNTLRHFAKPIPKSLGTIIGSYKSAVSKIIRKNTNFIQPVWQRNYYERIIRNNNELFSTREYIKLNPEK